MSTANGVTIVGFKYVAGTSTWDCLGATGQQSSGGGGGGSGSAYAASALDPGTGITANVNSDQATAINTWLLSLPNGTLAWFPPEAYYISHAIELPRGIKLAGAMYGIDCPQVIAMSGYSDAQMLRNWQTADQANYTGGASTFYSPNTTAWGSGTEGANYVNLENFEFDVNGNSNVTCVAFTNLQERTVIGHLTFTGSSGGSGNVCLALFQNNDSTSGLDGRFLLGDLTAYQNDWKHFIFLDGSNGGQADGYALSDLDITQFTTPANATNVCTDSPIYARAVARLNIVGHQEMTPLPNTADTAGIRLVNCRDVRIHDYYYSPGSGAERPFVKATSDTVDRGLGGSQVGPVLENVSFPSGGWSDRTDSSCGITSSSTTVTDTSISTSDVACPVFGPGIPSGTYIVSVVASTSFVMSNPAWLTGTVPLTISANIIEDNTAVGGQPRHRSEPPLHVQRRQFCPEKHHRLLRQRDPGPSTARTQPPRRSGHVHCRATTTFFSSRHPGPSRKPSPVPTACPTPGRPSSHPATCTRPPSTCIRVIRSRTSPSAPGLPPCPVSRTGGSRSSTPCRTRTWWRFPLTRPRQRGGRTPK